MFGISSINSIIYTSQPLYELCHDIIQIKLLEFHLPPFSPPNFFARRPMLKHNGPGKRNDLGEWWDDQPPFWKHFSNQAVQWKASICFYVAHLMIINGYQWNIDHFEMLLNIDFFPNGVLSSLPECLVIVGISWSQLCKGCKPRRVFTNLWSLEIFRVGLLAGRPQVGYVNQCETHQVPQHLLWHCLNIWASQQNSILLWCFWLFFLVGHFHLLALGTRHTARYLSVGDCDWAIKWGGTCCTKNDRLMFGCLQNSHWQWSSPEN